MPDHNEKFSHAVTTLHDPLRETGCIAAWALDYAREGDPRVETLASPALTRMPDDNQVMVWFGMPTFETDRVRSATAPLLDLADVAAAMRLRDPADQRASLAAHAGARLMLGAALNMPPSRVRIHRGIHGKPLLQSDLHFSIAHTRAAVAVAVARRPVGIDIERKVPLPDMLAIAALMFASESRAALCSVEETSQPELFYRFWTLGEAFIKATGLGVFQGLDTFAFTPDGYPRLLRVTSEWGPADRWRFGFC
jgi:phosphopantetheinyl transferase